MKMENCENVLGKCVKALEEEHGIKIKNPKWESVKDFGKNRED
jgi:hypothetical protein